jgi:Domain of unknown function (DUF4350)
MRRRPFFLALAGGLLCLGAWWFTQNYGVFPQRVWVGMSGEARANWLLAARMLLTRMGSNVQESSDLARLDAFPTTGTIFLAAERSDMTPERAARLLEWVEAGGHLVLGAQRELARDPLFEQLGVSAERNADRRAASKPDEVELPDGTRLRVDFLPSPRLYDEDETASWQHESGGGIRMLRIPYEHGSVTVLSTYRPFSNPAIGRLDHAELLWRLAADAGKPAPVWLVRRLDVESLPRWLIEHALPAMAALVLFLALALWRVVPRFGPLQPPPAPGRRSLVEHLSAMGRFYSMQRQLPRLIHVLRQNGLDLLGTRAPETRGMDGALRLKAAARLSGLRPRELLQAFTAPAATPHEFTNAVRVLAAFRRQITAHPRGSEAAGSRRREGADTADRRRDHRTRAEFDRVFNTAKPTDEAAQRPDEGAKRLDETAQREKQKDAT